MGVMERFDTARPVHASEFLTFRLGPEEYGIDILKVQEIRGYDTVTRIAGAPPVVKGVINLRGVIVPIVDLRMLFRLGEATVDALTVAIILNLGGRILGAVVDSVSDVLELEPAQIKAAPRFRSTPDANYLLGLGVLGSAEETRMILLVDIDKLMASSDIALVGVAAA
ncbi:MAG TPA: chemotaxis protein CheW [Burkholderiaceae bacterium]|nr:chemotaxis protein CheW [Burkholderiaceae bacterium]